MKGARLAGSVAEENQGDLSLIFFFGGESRAQSERNGAADNAGGRDKAGIDSDNVHRAALAGAVTARAAGQFGH